MSVFTRKKFSRQWDKLPPVVRNEAILIANTLIDDMHINRNRAVSIATKVSKDIAKKDKHESINLQPYLAFRG